MGEMAATLRPSPDDLSTIGEETLMRLTLHISRGVGDPFPLTLRLPATFKAGESSELFGLLCCSSCRLGFSTAIGDWFTSDPSVTFKTAGVEGLLGHCLLTVWAS